MLRFEMNFEELDAHRTRWTQRMVLKGASDEYYVSTLESGFGPNMGPGMERMARDMARYAEGSDG